MVSAIGINDVYICEYARVTYLRGVYELMTSDLTKIESETGGNPVLVLIEVIIISIGRIGFLVPLSGMKWVTSSGTCQTSSLSATAF